MTLGSQELTVWIVNVGFARCNHVVATVRLVGSPLVFSGLKGNDVVAEGFAEFMGVVRLVSASCEERGRRSMGSLSSWFVPQHSADRLNKWRHRDERVPGIWIRNRARVSVAIDQ